MFMPIENGKENSGGIRQLCALEWLRLEEEGEKRQEALSRHVESGERGAGTSASSGSKPTLCR